MIAKVTADRVDVIGLENRGFEQIGETLTLIAIEEEEEQQQETRANKFSNDQ